MPISTPLRLAVPSLLESYTPLAIVRAAEGLNIPFMNLTGLTLMAGEFILLNKKVCIVVGTTFPGKEGRAITDWVADVLLDTEMAALILAGEAVYWDYSNANGPAVGIGAATGVLPTNGLLIGYALKFPGDTSVNGSGKPIAASVDSLRVRVAANQTIAVAIGTLPTYE